MPFVYRLDGTDDATRAQIASLLATPGVLDDAELSILYDAAGSGYESDALDLAKHPVVLAKTSLSTTSQPGSLATPFALAALAAEDRLGPTAARLDDVAAFARLLWELSVVQTGGFYLRYATADGQELPASIFHAAGAVEPGEQATGDAAELTLAITFPAEAPLQGWHNAFLNPKEEGSLYLGLAESGGGALQALHPTYPPGCVGFEGTWALAELLAGASRISTTKTGWRSSTT